MKKIKNPTPEKIRALLLDRCGFRSTSVYDDGSISVDFGADDDCRYNIRFIFTVIDDQVLLIGASPEGFVVPSDARAKALMKINELNGEYSIVSAIMNDKGTIIVKRGELLDEEVSEAFMVENVLKLTVNNALQYIAELVRFVEEPDVSRFV
ncbi:MAG: hypothetical protein IJ760_05485 [Bacteroidales bacterium]|nr:hypothetical protein [Bacteroidales bacterium]